MGLVFLPEGGGPTPVAGQWALEENVMNGNWAEYDNVARKVARLACVGDDAQDSEFTLFYGETKICTFESTDLAAHSVVKKDWFSIPSKMWCRPGMPISIVLSGIVSSTRGHMIILDIKDARN